MRVRSDTETATKPPFDAADLGDHALAHEVSKPVPASERPSKAGMTLHLLPSDATDAEIEDLVRRIKGSDDGDAQ